MEQKNKIHISQLTWQPDLNKEAVLNQICVDFIQGGFYGILGPNGSGKTSLMKHILQMLKTKYGKMYYNDKRLDEFSRDELARTLSLVPQNTNIMTDYTVYDIAMMGRIPYQKRFQPFSKQDHEIVQNALRMTNCLQYKDQRFQSLSGGEAQRVITARAIAQQTPWLLLDEPVAHLDIHYQMELMNYLTVLNEQKNTSIITVLHDINLASRFCKQLVLMKQGKILAVGPTKEVLNVELLREVYSEDFIEQNHPSKNYSYFYVL